ncbi:MAG: NUDIX hydrolase [bacterium]|nr:NUDIX hydrolase [bacterium]
MEKRSAYGGIVCDEFGYMLLLEPKDHFGGYVWTFPKGVSKPGESPQQTALRKVLEETGVEASIDEPVPGVYEGDASTTSYFLMSLVGHTGDSGNRATASIRWVRFSGAPALIRKTENLKGRNRDLAVLGAALQIRSELAESGRMKPQVSPPPQGLEGVCTCSLPLPAHCPAVEVSESCVAVGCSIALDQGCEDHDSMGKDDRRLIEATNALVKRLVRSPKDRKSVADYARELYVRDDYPGSSLPKAVLFSIYKHDQFAYNGLALSPLGQAIINGEEAERWPGEGQTRGPTIGQMFEVYSMRYQDTGP